MLTYVPVRFDLYRTIRAPLRWTLQCLVAFADREGKCWPSVRKLAEVADIGKSTVSRHLAELARAGVISRTRKPGGVYTYRIDSRFLPAAGAFAVGVSQPEAPARSVSRRHDHAVPRLLTEEKAIKKNPDLDQIDDRDRWEARLRAWRNSGGRFWPAFAGPRPDEADCWAPRDMIDRTIAGIIGYR